MAPADYGEADAFRPGTTPPPTALEGTLVAVKRQLAELERDFVHVKREFRSLRHHRSEVQAAVQSARHVSLGSLLRELEALRKTRPVPPCPVAGLHSIDDRGRCVPCGWDPTSPPVSAVRGCHRCGSTVRDNGDCPQCES